MSISLSHTLEYHRASEPIPSLTPSANAALEIFVKIKAKTPVMRTIFKIQLHPCPPNPGTAVHGVHRQSKNLRNAFEIPLKRSGYWAVLPLVSVKQGKYGQELD